MHGKNIEFYSNTMTNKNSYIYNLIHFVINVSDVIIRYYIKKKILFTFVKMNLPF